MLEEKEKLAVLSQIASRFFLPFLGQVITKIECRDWHHFSKIIHFSLMCATSALLNLKHGPRFSSIYPLLFCFMYGNSVPLGILSACGKEGFLIDGKLPSISNKWPSFPWPHHMGSCLMLLRRNHAFSAYLFSTADFNRW